MFGASFRSFAASTALSRTAIQESTGGKTQVKLTLFFEPKPSIDCLQENKEWMVNVCFITFVDSWSSFSHDGTDCDCSSRISTWAVAQGENCYIFIYIVCKLHEIVIQSWTPCHSTSHNSDVGVNLMSFMFFFQSVLGALVIVNLKGMLMQFRELPFLWKNDQTDFVSFCFLYHQLFCEWSLIIWSSRSSLQS